MKNIEKTLREQIEKQFISQRKLHESIARTMTSQMAGITAAILNAHRPFEQFRKHVEKQARLTRQIFEQFRPNIEAIKQMRENSKNFSRETKSALRKLGEQGWYLDHDTTPAETWKFARAIDNDDHDEAQKALVTHYRRRYPEIFTKLTEKHPHRAKIINQAAVAHKKKQFYLSVPVLLAQADGICKEHTGFELFKKEHGRPVTARIYDLADEDSLRAAFLYPLSIILPILDSKEPDKADSQRLNRHEVLHGVNLQYGTEVNSLKSISLLYYITNVLIKKESIN